MITLNNYYNAIDNIDFNKLPDALRKGKELVDKTTNNGEDWDNYHSSNVIKKTIDIYFSKLNEFINQDKKAEKKPKETGEKSKKIIKQKKPPVLKSKKEAAYHPPPGLDEEDYPQDFPPRTNYENWRIRFRDLSKMNAEELEEELDKINDVENYNGLTDEEREYSAKISHLLYGNEKPTLVEKIPEELRFIKKYVLLHGKTKTKDEILRFINSLQKAIVEKRIRKTSNWAHQIRTIQLNLINLYNSMKPKIKVKWKADTIEEYKRIARGEAIMPSINFIKRYINLNGKEGVKINAKQLLQQINKAFEKGKIIDSDIYVSQLNEIRKNLEDFLADKSEKVLRIEMAVLNGLEGILGCACNQLNGINPTIMNSMDFANLEFETLGFTGKWLTLIGDPSKNFTSMVFGKPKLGKTTLCLDFANYLAQNHGKVLYAAKEEGLDMTLQKKINENGLRHPNLTVASFLPSDLSAYNFIFLDSVNKFGLKPEDLNSLKSANPSKSFIFIFQTTKLGAFRGANTFQHDVDVVIEVPEMGKAVQMGRFNQGGEMQIFNDRSLELAA